ncbi:hypothetical protein [Nocardioides stalactiti]|uniref:hypothetical protein n=1 Tax=Nocardioides stalactiti TaxID=2755356 RepID=UPI0016021D39|nr:hypothetical protein [Nocardioides stalactiti]
MEILLWLVPAAVVTLVTMLWVAWWGREGRGEIDRETAARRLGEALTREQKRRPGYAVERRAPDRSTGVALRAPRPQALPPVAAPAAEPAVDPVAEPAAGTVPDPVSDPVPEHDRRAS